MAPFADVGCGGIAKRFVAGLAQITYVTATSITLPNKDNNACAFSKHHLWRVDYIPAKYYCVEMLCCCMAQSKKFSGLGCQYGKCTAWRCLVGLP
jgi:hypothetical protein